MNPPSLLTGALVLLAGLSPAQILTVANPVAPGSLVVASVFNALPGARGTVGGELRLHSADGEVIHPLFASCGSVGDVFGIGATFPLTLQLPPGNSLQGSYLLRAAFGSATGPYPVTATVARLDIGSADPGFPSLHLLSPFSHLNGRSHQVPRGAAVHVEIGNTAPVPHVFGPGDELALHLPGEPAPVFTLPLQGTVIGSNRVLMLPLSVTPHLVPTANATLRLRWTDPSRGPQQQSRGLVLTDAPQLDLQLPGGKDVPRQGSIPVVLASGVTEAVPPPARLHVLALGHAPGVTPLPNGSELPLVFDFLVQQSLANGLGGLLQNAIGGTTESRWFCASRGFETQVATGLAIVHPNLAAVAGLEFRIAAILIDPATLTIQPSQAEAIRFR
jgi:hypothetical protein